MNISWPVLLLFCGMLIAIVLILLWHPQRFRTKTRASADSWSHDAVFRNRDDERYWPGGIFYSNPDDPSMLVPKRFGIGWTLNFGNPRSKLFLAGLLLLPLVIAILTVLVSGTAPAGCHTLGCNPFP